MEQSDSLDSYDGYRKADTFLTLSALRAEAKCRGEAWTHHRLADLKIDLDLATQQGDETHQTMMTRFKIERLEADLKPSIFDVKPEDNDDPVNGFALQYAATHLARQAIEVAFRDSPVLPDSFRDVVTEAREYLNTERGREIAYDNMMLIENLPGVIMEDVNEIISRARSLLENIL